MQGPIWRLWLCVVRVRLSVVAEALEAIETGVSMPSSRPWMPSRERAAPPRRRSRRPSTYVAKIEGEWGVPGLNAVTPERFQRLEVIDRVPIRYFVESMGAKFLKGHGFYELTNKAVTIQEYKEVVLRDRRTGDLFSGREAREMIGFPYGKRGKFSLRNVPYDISSRYQIFVQSTSYNRVLLPGTWFLYEGEVM
jgi:hypothetical protein